MQVVPYGLVEAAVTEISLEFGEVWRKVWESSGASATLKIVPMLLKRGFINVKRRITKNMLTFWYVFHVLLSIRLMNLAPRPFSFSTFTLSCLLYGVQ